jgi:hypothetical protein
MDADKIVSEFRQHLVDGGKAPLRSSRTSET